MEIGGSQLNAVQLAGAVRDRGHDVIVMSEPGPLVERVHKMGLRTIEISLHRRRPSPKVIQTMVRVVRDLGVDVVHGYEWPPIIEAFLGPALLQQVPVVGTVMSMSVAPFLPRTVPLMVGTELIRRAALEAGHQHVTLLEPPVDAEADTPLIDGGALRAKYGIGPKQIVIAMICRLVPELKLEGLLAACDSVGEMARSGRDVRLLIVGDGRARETVAAHAAQANATAGRNTVVMTGEILDPASAYAAADIIIGQGGSALRGMAFGKPLIVIGEDGFSELLTPQSLPTFLRQGWYGLGPGSLGAGASALRMALERLADSPSLRGDLGQFARNLVVERFSLRQAADRQEQMYLSALQDTVPAFARLADFVRSTAGLTGGKLQRGYQRWRGTAAIDDSNARDLIARILASHQTAPTTASAQQAPAKRK
ncbi:glycosyltransferase family 4 protein [Nitrobacter hamburgensis]|nr:glycosyltransferase family 4 protein [Nitrobacter hamburgensis]